MQLQALHTCSWSLCRNVGTCSCFASFSSINGLVYFFFKVEKFSKTVAVIQMLQKQSENLLKEKSDKLRELLHLLYNLKKKAYMYISSIKCRVTGPLNCYSVSMQIKTVQDRIIVLAKHLKPKNLMSFKV